MLRAVFILLLLCLPYAVPAAAEEAAPLTVEQAASRVLEALKTQDPAAYEALATGTNPDPWRVADELIRQKAHDAARLFANAASDPATKALAAYVAARHGAPDAPARRARIAAASRAFRAGNAAAALAALGDAESPIPADVIGVRLASGRAAALQATKQLQRAAEAHGAAGDAAAGIGWLAQAEQAYAAAGMAAYQLRRYPAAAGFWEKRVEVCKQLGEGPRLAGALSNLGVAYFESAQYPKARAAHTQSLALNKKLGDKPNEAANHVNLGMLHAQLKEHEAALGAYERARELKQALGDGLGTAKALGDLATVHGELGDHARAAEANEAALAIMHALGNKPGESWILRNIGSRHWKFGQRGLALAAWKKAWEIKKASGDRKGAVRLLYSVGFAQKALGNFDAALDTFTRVREEELALGNKRGAAATLNMMGAVHDARGAYALALSTYERARDQQVALGDKVRAASTLSNLGNTYVALGNLERAIASMQQALAEQEANQDAKNIPITLANLGSAYKTFGEHEKALKIHRKALALYTKAGNLPSIASTHGRIGAVYLAMNRFEEARASLELSLERYAAPRAKSALGTVYSELGKHDKALALHTEALATLRQSKDQAGVASVLGHIAVTHAALGDAAKAIDVAREAVVATSSLARGLGGGEGDGARERAAFIYAVGSRASVVLKRPADLAYFLESGRAGSLLEGLKARTTLWAAAVPEALRQQEADARSAEAAATEGLARASRTRNRTAIRARQAELKHAQGLVLAAIARIQREAKAGAALVYPEAATLDAIQKTLAPGDALVMFGLFEGMQGCALVATHTAARTVNLANASTIENAAQDVADALQDVGETERPAEVVKQLTALIATPLRLGKDIKRVLVSPTGWLGYVPFAALFPKHEIVYVPSGTTYGILAEQGAGQGANILALGDPDYGTVAKATALAHRGSARSQLVPLPQTRPEVQAIGTTKLLGLEATESGLRAALGREKGWRAVHFACHGLVDPSRPLLSSLAVTADTANDGFLTALEIFRMKIPADLVVLSACETGKGRIYKTEGIVGLTRAFMFAGAPRVLCSLWKVDDAATRTLMIEFYNQWNKQGLPPAAALKKAQAHIRQHLDKNGKRHWKHPYYWAAWVLWGLPD